uniref:methyl-accepting chemotaxis protein n=1 Tax=Halalkalirubrum salinum TaxID=2563889 RepID=UPI0010FAE4F7
PTEDSDTTKPTEDSDTTKPTEDSDTTKPTEDSNTTKPIRDVHTSETIEEPAEIDSKALETLTEKLRAAADGDLTVRADLGTADAQAVAAAEAFNDLVSAYESTVNDVSGVGAQVIGATTQVDDRMESITEASREAARSTEAITGDVTEQQQMISALSAEIRGLSAATEEIASSAEEVATTSEAVFEKGQRGEKAARDAREELAAITTRTETVLESIESLNERVDAIEESAAFITEVAGQTNILALNASIEAARAGEAGEGFAVVAEEVKSLAEDAEEAATAIEQSVDAVKTETSQTLSEMRETAVQVESGAETVEQAAETFDEIAAEIEETNGGVQEISEATDDQANSLQEAAGMVENVDDLASDTARNAEAVSTTMTNHSTSVSEASTSVTTLTERIDTLERTIAGFETTANTAAEDVDTVVEFWHAMGGDKGVLVESLAEEFTADHEDVAIVPRSQGSYRDTFETTLAAVERGEGPVIAQLYEIGTARAVDSGLFTPVASLLPSGSTAAYLDPIADYYRVDGQLCSMPFNSSVPVLCYNRDAFETAGLDPNRPPATYDAVVDASEAIVDAGVCPTGITFANYSWFVEQWLAAADQPIVDAANGHEGTPRTAYFDSDAAHKLYEWWTAMDDAELYENPGIEARGEAKRQFVEGDAAMLIGSASSLGSIRNRVPFSLGVAALPAAAGRAGVVVGGGSLWVPKTASTAEQAAAGEFLAWLAEPAQQVRWHTETGYLPVHEDAVRSLRRDGWFEANPGYEVAIEQLLASDRTVATRGARIGPFDTVRTIVANAYADVESMGVEAGLDRLNAQVEQQLESYAE